MTDSPARDRWRQVEALLDEALDRPPADRESLVRARCGDDRELADEVLGLLAANEATGVLDRPLGDLARAAVEPAEAIGTGQRVGTWRLLEPLGSGGMGRVFLARREGGDFEQRAALKLLRWEVATTDLLARFRRERQILADLDHPGIARLIDGGVTDHGLPYLVMEPVDGSPIDRHCRERRLSLAERLRLMLQVCDAVRAAHARLVIHRDLKPSNILVTSAGQARLLDFGVGKLLDDDLADAPGLTAALPAPATPGYAAPEQLEGRPMSVATDVYGLGVVLYELLAGRRPFEAERQSPLELARQVVEAEPPAPSRASRGADAKQLRGDLDHIVLKALRKEPAERYASVDALAADIERYLEGREVLAMPPTARYRLGKFVRRHRVPTALATLLLVGAIAAGAAITHQARIARLEATRAQATAEFLERTLVAANLESESAADDSLSALLDRAAPRVDDELAELPGVRARVRRLLAQAYHGLGRREDASRLFHRAHGESVEHFGADSPEAAWASVGIALADTMEGSEERLARLEPALEVMRRTRGPRSRDAMEVLNLIGNSLAHAGELDDAEAAYRETLDIAREVFGPDHVWSATVLANLGSLLRRQGRDAESLEFLRRGLELYVSNGHGESAIALAIRNNLAVALAEAGHLEAAEVEYRAALALQETLLGPGHPRVGRTLTNLGRLLMDQGRFHDAAEPVERAVSVLGAAVPDGDFGRVAAEINRASLLLELGGIEEAHSLYTTAHRTFTEQLGPDHSASLRVGWLLAEAERRRSRRDAAHELLARGADAQRPADDLSAAHRLLVQGRVEIDDGRPERAEESLRSALSIYRAALGDGHWRVAETAAELVVAATRDPEALRRELAPQLAELRRALPDGNWRLARLAGHLETDLDTEPSQEPDARR
ncbi:MAG: serine/threonine-protein kinase [Acidobacteriota bacterium]